MDVMRAGRYLDVAGGCCRAPPITGPISRPHAGTNVVVPLGGFACKSSDGAVEGFVYTTRDGPLDIIPTLEGTRKHLSCYVLTISLIPRLFWRTKGEHL